jgi:hypothetical protein
MTPQAVSKSKKMSIRKRVLKPKLTKPAVINSFGWAEALRLKLKNLPTRRKGFPTPVCS